MDNRTFLYDLKKNKMFIINTYLININVFSTGKVTEKILRAYQEEQKLHQSLLLRVADSTDPDVLIFYLSCWTYLPYLDHSIEKELHCMIKETRHV